MKTFAFIAATGLLASTQAASVSKQPGWCKNDDTCTKESSNYTCVSVQTTRAGVEDVKQCLPYSQPGDVCAGVTPGLCPMFSTWESEYQSISSVCAYIIPSSKCITSKTKNTKGKVACLEVEVSSSGSGDESDSDAVEGSESVIYGCVDFDGTNLLFEKNSDNWKLAQTMNYTGIINDDCVNPSKSADSDVVCSGRGTCAPNSASSMDYACLCNVGYSGKYCQKVDSNKCTTEAQCAAGTCNLDTQECECEKGTTGDQCATCDPDYSKSCNGHGTCEVANSTSSSAEGSSSGALSVSVGSSSGSSVAYACSCDDGYSGSFCTRKIASGDVTKSDTSVSTDGSGSPSVMTSVGAVVLASVLAIVA